MWFMYSLIGSISLVVLNTLSKLYEPNLLSIIILSSISIFTTFCFWEAWQHSDRFLMVWFVNSAMVSLGGLIANKFIIRQPLLINEMLGIAMILLGAFLLKK